MNLRQKKLIIEFRITSEVNFWIVFSEKNGIIVRNDEAKNITGNYVS